MNKPRTLRFWLNGQSIAFVMDDTLRLYLNGTLASPSRLAKFGFNCLLYFCNGITPEQAMAATKAEADLLGKVINSSYMYSREDDSDGGAWRDTYNSQSRTDKPRSTRTIQTTLVSGVAWPSIKQNKPVICATTPQSIRIRRSIEKLRRATVVQLAEDTGIPVHSVRNTICSVGLIRVRPPLGGCTWIYLASSEDAPPNPVMSYIHEHPGCNCEEIAAGFGVASATIYKVISRLERTDEVRVESRHVPTSSKPVRFYYATRTPLL